jgi:hypothetical protein
VESYVSYDTIKENDTVIIISESAGQDSVFIADTVLNSRVKLAVDTLYRLDSIPCEASIVTPTFIPTVPEDAHLVTEEGSKSLDSLVYDPQTGLVTYHFSSQDTPAVEAFTPQDGQKALISTNVLYVNKTLTLANGVTGQLSYTDRDGDGFLYSAALNTVPQALLTGDLQKSGLDIILSAAYDAGVGGNLTATADNRIEALNKYSLMGADTLEQVIYTNDYIGEATTDTLQLKVILRLDRDTLIQRNTDYKITQSGDAYSTPMFFLAGIDQRLHFSSTSFTRAEIRLVPSSPILKSENLDELSFTASVYNNQEKVLSFEGIMNEQDGISGEYIYENRTYTIHSDFNGNMEIE